MNHDFGGHYADWSNVFGGLFGGLDADWLNVSGGLDADWSNVLVGLMLISEMFSLPRGLVFCWMQSLRAFVMQG